MNLSFHIAFRYLFSKKNRTAINIITFISLIGITVGTASLILVLSVFNGFESLIKNIYDDINPDYLITKKNFQSFSTNSINYDKILEIVDCNEITEIYDRKVLIQSIDNENKIRNEFGILRGINKIYSNEIGYFEKFISKGQNINNKGLCIIGSVLANSMLLNPDIELKKIDVFVPNKNMQFNSLKKNNFFSKTRLLVSGTFHTNTEIDNKLIITSMDFFENSEYSNEISSIEVRTKIKNSNIKESLIKIFAHDFLIKNKYEQQNFLYRILKTEKLIIYIILTFILAVASFNIISSIIMTILEKKHDINLLWNLGGQRSSIKNIFIIQGFLISLFGAIFGIIIGLTICFIQEKFGLIKLGNPDAFIISYYPIKIKIIDIISVVFTVIFLGLLLSIIPSNLINYFTKKLNN